MTDKNQMAAVRELLTPKEEVAEVVTEEVTDELAAVEGEEVVAAPEDEATDVVAESAGEEGDPAAEEGSSPGEPAEEKYSVATLADAIGWEASDLYAVEVSMGDGAEPVTLGQLKDQYQSTLREKEQLSEQVATVEEQLKSAQVGAQAGQQMDQEVMQAVAQVEALRSRYQSVDWAQVESEDPGGAALLRQKYQEAFQQADGGVKQAQYNVQARQQQGLQQAAVQMLELIPEWRDPAVKQADQNEIRQAMLAEGFPNEIINSIREPKALVHWKKYVELVKFKESQDMANSQAVKAVRNAPKVLGTGARRKAEPKDDLKELRKQLDSAGPSGKRKAQEDLARAILGQRR